MAACSQKCVREHINNLPVRQEHINRFLTPARYRDERLRELQKELVKKANQKADYDAIADDILRLRDMRKHAEVDSVVKDEQMRMIQDLQDFIKSQPTTITEFDETLVKRLITKITVFEDHFTVAFKSGVIIEIEA